MKIEQINKLKRLAIKKDNLKKLLDYHRNEPLMITIHNKSNSVTIEIDPNQIILESFLFSEMDDTKKEIKHLLRVMNENNLWWN